MEKIKANVPMVAFLLLLTKGLVVGLGQFDVAALLVSAALFAITELVLENKRIIALEEETKKINESQASTNKRLDEVRNHVGSLKLGQQQRSSFGR